MRTPVRVLIAATALLVSGCVQAPPPGKQPVAVPDTLPGLAVDSRQQRDTEITVRVRNRGCASLASGSGFAVASNVLVTNKHVVEEADELQLDTWDGRSVLVRVHQVAFANDLALVETADPLPRVAELATGDPSAGTAVSVIGYPLGGRLERSGGAVIDQVPGDRLGNAGSVLRISAKVQPGNSGGPLVNGDGLVVGVVYAIERATGYGLAIPVSSLRAVMSQQQLYQPPHACDRGSSS
jgi:S1-C subfamily serine protease